MKDYWLLIVVVCLLTILTLSGEDGPEALKNNREQLFNLKNAAVFGNPNSEDYVIEFFDYNCGYCKSAVRTVSELIEKNKKIKIMLIEFPIFGEQSEIAASAAIVVKILRPGKYFIFHKNMMAHRGPKDLAAIRQVARESGISDINFAEEMQKPEVRATLQANKKIAGILGIRSTPVFIVNDNFVNGAAQYQHIVDLLAQPKK